MVTNSWRVVQKVNRRCPTFRQHSTREGDMSTQSSSSWAAVLCRAIHAGTEDQVREDQDKAIAFLAKNEFYDETTDEKLDKKKVAEARRDDEVLRCNVRFGLGLYSDLHFRWSSVQL